jgi:hypothetical protein
VPEKKDDAETQRELSTRAVAAADGINGTDGCTVPVAVNERINDGARADTWCVSAMGPGWVCTDDLGEATSGYGKEGVLWRREHNLFI